MGLTRPQWWAAGTLAANAGATGAMLLWAPAAGATAPRPLALVVAAGSSAHVAASGWFATVPDVRRHARRHPVRYLVAPAALVVGAALLSLAAGPSAAGSWLLLGFFGWQFFHFQKQNLGLAALGAPAGAPLTRAERQVLTLVAAVGIAALVARPTLLALADLPTASDPVRAAMATATAALVIAGAGLVARRPAADRPLRFVLLYAWALLYFVPVLALETPYAATGVLVLSHGLQYLWIMGFVAGGDPAPDHRPFALFALVNIAAVGGLALEGASHGDRLGAPAGRLLFGAYLGVVMSHFVVDAGLWRLRDEFPRAFLTERLGWISRRRS